MNYKLFLTILIFCSWCIFSAKYEIFYVISGLISVFITLIILTKMDLLKSKIPFKFKFKYFYFMFWMIKEVLKSSIEVTILIWKGKKDFSSVIDWIDCNLENDFKKVIYANSVTLTPGTICLNIKYNKMQVHCLTKENLVDLKRNEMFNLIRLL